MTTPIIVTGPQRSGTTIAAQILAHDFGYTYVDESEYNPQNLPPNAVIQAPFLLKCVLELSYFLPTASFVFMYRDKQEIVKSMKRIQWYNDFIDNPLFYSDYVNHCYDYISLLESTLSSTRWKRLNYSDLASHPLFVKQRKNFTVRQWQANRPVGEKTWRNHESVRTYQVRL